VPDTVMGKKAEGKVLATDDDLANYLLVNT
jgi:hypothetical protein